jgi:S-adenosylmethionine synthetase
MESAQLRPERYKRVGDVDIELYAWLRPVVGVAIGGGALCGKDPHKVDKCGALRARQLAKRLVRNGADEARLILGWAPGGDAPFLIETSTSQGGVNLQVPRGELPPEDWFTIKSIVRDLELQERDWAADLLAGYFCQASAPWER